MQFDLIRNISSIIKCICEPPMDSNQHCDVAFTLELMTKKREYGTTGIPLYIASLAIYKVQWA